MNKKILFIAFGLISLINLNAKKIEGVIIYNNDSVAHVTLDIPVQLIFKEVNFQGLQNGVVYYNSQDKKVKLSPEQIKEIRFEFDYEKIRMISCVDNLKLTKTNFFWSSKKILLKLKTEGKLRLYTYYFTQSTPAMSNGAGGTMGGSSYGAERAILQKDNGDLFEPRWLHFEKDMKKYLSDCPILVEKIDNRSYKSGDIDLIVWDYNRCRTN